MALTNDLDLNLQQAGIMMFGVSQVLRGGPRKRNLSKFQGLHLQPIKDVLGYTAYGRHSCMFLQSPHE